jgi:hypothetical protein
MAERLTLVVQASERGQQVASQIQVGDKIHRQLTTGRIHRTANCSVARRTRYSLEPQTVTESLVEHVEANHPYAQLCKKCYGA